ncbi:glycosyltransferase involved in cell wall biosynthesis [Pseudonocardia sediminis]|uniref:Glycosyltransferase involved in cell wall biosynthesis n=1 Tax=Pseudonocardia sediminis TaxID=1397368 RepID=A0A4Q7V558_PSEST|nr:glycosyltransferase family 4 protein [Pseudonocardia sediminis]RZT87893.1 glycosyltransferase involved in cell wall biosynthesis [Pseudonocardia sediminis]
MAIVWIGPLPPPVHGASLITQRYLDLVRRHADDVEVVPIEGTTGRGRARFHLSRVAAHLRAVRAVLAGGGDATVYLSLGGGPSLWYQLPVVLAARARGARLVLHHHSYKYIAAHAAAMSLVCRSGPGARHLFLSAAMADAFTARYPVADRRVVSNAHFVEPAEREGPEPEGIALIHVSNLSVPKGSLTALRTHAALREAGVEATLTLIGPVADPQVRAYLDDPACSADPSVRHLGAQPTATIYRELDRAGLFLFPTSYENEAEPLVVLEALSRGVPVLAARRGALPEVLPGDWLVDDPAPGIWAEAVLAHHREPWAERSGRARRAFGARRAGADVVELVTDAASAGDRVS